MNNRDHLFGDTSMSKPTHTKQQIIDTLTRKLATSASTITVCTDGARDALELLKQPTLPKEPTIELVDILNSCGYDKRAAYYKLYNHLTAPPKPKTKKIKVWRVEYVIGDEPRTSRIYTVQSEANTFASSCYRGVEKCINIIEGEQEVPAT